MNENGWRKKTRAKLRRNCRKDRWKRTRTKNKKKKAMGGMIVIKKELAEQGEGEDIKEERIIEGRIKCGKRKLMIVGIYVNGDMERKLQLLERWMEGREEEIRMVIKEDFNAKTREEGGRIGLKGGK